MTLVLRLLGSLLLLLGSTVPIVAASANLSDTRPDLFIFTNTTPLAGPRIPIPIEVTFGNRAQTIANDVVITVTTPTRFTSVPAPCTVTGGTARCSIGSLDPAPADLSQYIPRTFDIWVDAPDASAATFTIEMSIESSEPDNAPADNHFSRDGMTYRTATVTNTNDSGSGSLRAAIDQSNAECTDTWPCLIAFRIPATQPGGIQISPLTPLPHILGRYVSVDAVLQSIYYRDTRIALEGSALASGSALELDNLCGGTIRGLMVYSFPGAAVRMNGANDCGFPAMPRIIQANLFEHNGRGIELAAPAMVADNVIRENRRSGVFLVSQQASVLRNTINGNGASGIFAGSDAHGTDISDNQIENNAEFGIAIAKDAQNISAHRNAISGNGLHGIDWGLDAVANGPVPIPVITRVYAIEIGAWAIEGTIEPSGTFQPSIELFASSSADPSGRGEGARYLGTINAASGTFTFTLIGNLAGQWITATATRAVYNGWLRTPAVRSNGDTGWGYFTTTSEFSNAVKGSL